MDRGHSVCCCRSADFICERGDGNEVKADQSNGAERTKKGLTYSYMGM
jgi:hypothetical protein